MKKLLNILLLLSFLFVSAAQATTNPPPIFNLSPGNRLATPHTPSFSAPHVSSTFDINALSKSIWFSAIDSVTTQSVGKVTAITDISGNHKDLALGSGGTNETTYDATNAYANGHPAYVFTDSDNDTYFRIPSNTTIQDVYAVCQFKNGDATSFDGGTSFPTIMAGDNATGGHPRISGSPGTSHFGTSTVGTQVYNENILKNYATSSPVDGNGHTIALPMRFGVYRFQFTTPQTDQFYFFGAPSTPKAWRGVCSEIIGLSTLANSSTSSGIITYLLNKYGLLTQPTTTISAISDDAAVDLVNTTITDPTGISPVINLKPKLSQTRDAVTNLIDPTTNLWGHWAFELTGVNGKRPVIYMDPAHSYNGKNPRAVWSYDRITWHVFTTGTSFNGGATYIYSDTTVFNQDTVYMASIEPFAQTEMDAWLTANSGSAYIHELPSAIAYGGVDHQIGVTTNGRPIYAFRVSDDSATPAGGGAKKKIVITGTGHPSEHIGRNVAKAFADFILGSDAEAIDFRKEFDTWICLLQDPDSVADGQYRYTTYPETRDPNRNVTGVGAAGPGYEVEIVRNAIISDGWTSLGGALDFHGGATSIYFGGFTEIDPYYTDLHTTVASFLGQAVLDYQGSPGIPFTSVSRWERDTLGANYSVGVEMGTDVFNTYSQITDYGVAWAKTLDALLKTTAPANGARLLEGGSYLLREDSGKHLLE